MCDLTHLQLGAYNNDKGKVLGAERLDLVLALRRCRLEETQYGLQPSSELFGGNERLVLEGIVQLVV